MPVTQTHDDYKTELPRWNRCLDLYAGQDAIKAKTTTYLPLLKAHKDAKDAAYVAYRDRAVLFGAFRRTVNSLSGNLFRNAWDHEDLEASEQWAELLEDATLHGESLENLEGNVVHRILQTGRYGLFADYNEELQRPYLTGYTETQIRDWLYETTDGQLRLKLVILEETADIPAPNADDEFARTDEKRYRVLRLDDDNLYRHDLYVPDGDGGYVADPDQASEPNQRGQRLDAIPFVFINPYDLSADIHPPPLIELADLVIDHYRMDADLKNGLHFTGLPTPWFSNFNFVTDDPANPGQTIKRKDVVLGSEYALVSDNPTPGQNAQAGFLEVTSGFEGLIGEKGRDEARMAAVGSRVIEERGAEAESFLALRYRGEGEHSAVALLGINVAAGINEALKFAAFWLPSGREVEPNVQSNTELVDRNLMSADLLAWLQTWRDGGIDHDTFLHILERYGYLRESDTIENVKERIANEAAQIGNLLQERTLPEPEGEEEETEEDPEE